jgi:hypothetical protein
MLLSTFRERGINLDFIDVKFPKLNGQNVDQSESKTTWFTSDHQFKSFGYKMNQELLSSDSGEQADDLSRFAGNKSDGGANKIGSKLTLSSNIDPSYSNRFKDIPELKLPMASKLHPVIKENVIVPHSDHHSEITRLSTDMDHMITKDDIKKIVDNLVQTTKLQISPGKTQIRVHLKPDYLGMVKIIVENNGREITGTIYIERSEVRQAFEYHLPVIQKNLQEQNVKLDRLDIQDFSNQFTQQNSSHQADQDAKDFKLNPDTKQHNAKQLSKKKIGEEQIIPPQERKFGYNTLELIV